MEVKTINEYMENRGEFAPHQEKPNELLKKHERWTIEQRHLLNSLALGAHSWGIIVQITLGLLNFHKDHNRSAALNVAFLLLSVMLGAQATLARPKLLKELKEKQRLEQEEDEDIVGAISTKEEYENARENKKTTP